MNRVTKLIDIPDTPLPPIPATTLVAYFGAITQDIETSLITQVEACLIVLKCSDNYKVKILGIIVELLQNLHADNIAEEGISACTFKLEKAKKGFIVSTSNLMKAKKVMPLQKRIEYLNTLTQIELANLYRDILNNGNADRLTAGLGLIDIRRKSGRPILFKFEPLESNNLTLFTVKVLV